MDDILKKAIQKIVPALKPAFWIENPLIFFQWLPLQHTIPKDFPA